MKNKTRRTFLLIILLTLLGITYLLSACATKSAIIGSWRLIESEDPTYPVGIFFEFREDGTLNLLPGVAVLSEDDLVMFSGLQERLALSYQANPNGDLRLTLDKVEGGTAVLRMTYSIEGDVLTITDEHNVVLSFRRQ